MRSTSTEVSRATAGRPYTTNQGKNVHVRVRRVDDTAVGGIGSWAAHERIVVRRLLRSARLHPGLMG